MRPVPANVVVVVLLIAMTLITWEIKDDATVPDQSPDDKRRSRKTLSMVPVLGIRG